MKAKSNVNRINEIQKYLYSQGKVYLDKRGEDLREIQQSLEDIKDNSNLEKIKKIGHKIKGSAGLYGFSELSEIGVRLEDTALKGDLNKLFNVVNEFRSFLNEVNNEKN